jgi:hypothetical protein
MSMSLLAGFPRRYLTSFFELTKERQQGYEHIPAYDSTDTAGFHGVEMVHDRGMDGLNLCARDSGRVLA